MVADVLTYAKNGGSSAPNINNSHGINGGPTFVSNNKPYDAILNGNPNNVSTERWFHIKEM